MPTKAVLYGTKSGRRCLRQAATRQRQHGEDAEEFLKQAAVRRITPSQCEKEDKAGIATKSATVDARVPRQQAKAGTDGAAFLGCGRCVNGHAGYSLVHGARKQTTRPYHQHDQERDMTERICHSGINMRAESSSRRRNNTAGACPKDCQALRIVTAWRRHRRRGAGRYLGAEIGAPGGPERRQRARPAKFPWSASRSNDC